MKVKLGEIIQKPISGVWGDIDEKCGLKVIRTTNFTNDGVINFNNIVKCNLGNIKLTNKFLREGDILIEKSGGSDKQPVGRVVYFDIKGDQYLFNNFTSCLRISDQKSWDARYIFYALYANYLRGGTIPYQNKTTGLHNLKLEKYIDEFTISQQSYEKQIGIVHQLDKVINLIDKRKQQLEKLDSLVKSKFIEMFGVYDLHKTQFDWVKIGTVAEVVGGSTPNTAKSEYWGGVHYWITPAEISEDSFVIKSTDRTLTDEGVKSCSLKLLPKGTVLLSSRAPIGKLAIVGVEMYCNQGFKNLICSEKLNSIYTFYLLKYNSDYLNSLGRGATFKEISKAIVENIHIPVPSIELQNEFARFVEQVDKSKLKIKQNLEKLETLKKALMQKYFG